jgi:hypothetical protein
LFGQRGAAATAPGLQPSGRSSQQRREARRQLRRLREAKRDRPATLHGVVSLFRRKPAEVVAEDSEPVAEDTKSRGKTGTPSKRELGVATPKRPTAQARRAEPPPANRREALKRERERRRADRAEQRAGMEAGDERYLLARDRGPERALVRDMVDSRRSIVTWFFGGALLVLVGSNRGMPPIVQTASTALWLTLALLVAVDSVLICRRVSKRIRTQFPKTDQRMGGLFMYAVFRAMTFRRMRMPKPRVNYGDAV